MAQLEQFREESVNEYWVDLDIEWLELDIDLITDMDMEGRDLMMGMECVSLNDLDGRHSSETRMR